MTNKFTLAYWTLCLCINAAISQWNERPRIPYRPAYISNEPRYGDDPVYDYTKVVYPDGKPVYPDEKPVYPDGKHFPNKPGHRGGPIHKIPKCEPEMIFTFNNPIRPFEEIRNRIYAKRVGKVAVYEGSANFFGRGHIEIPYFKQNDLRPGYFLSIVIRPAGYNGRPQAIFSNSFYPNDASLTLSLEGDRAVLTIVERPHGKYGYYPSEPIQLSVHINKKGYTKITIEQDDTTVILTSDLEVMKAPALLPVRTNEPMYIGAGASALRKLFPFEGAVDLFIFDKCPVHGVY